MVNCEPQTLDIWQSVKHKMNTNRDVHLFYVPHLWFGIVQCSGDSLTGSITIPTLMLNRLCGDSGASNVFLFSIVMELDEATITQERKKKQKWEWTTQVTKTIIETNCKSFFFFILFLNSCFYFVLAHRFHSNNAEFFSNDKTNGKWTYVFTTFFFFIDVFAAIVLFFYWNWLNCNLYLSSTVPHPHQL